MEPAQPTLEERALWRRRWAAAANNRAWELAERPERSAEETAELVQAAYAAAWLWREIGDELNQARSWLLLGQALGLAGQGGPALDHARRSLAYFSTHACPDWESAFAQLALATAAHAAGERELFQTARAEAARLGGLIADSEDRKIFDSSFRLLAEA